MVILCHGFCYWEKSMKTTAASDILTVILLLITNAKLVWNAFLVWVLILCRYKVAAITFHPAFTQQLYNSGLAITTQAADDCTEGSFKPYFCSSL